MPVPRLSAVTLAFTLAVLSTLSARALDRPSAALYHNHPSHPEAVNPEEFSPADRELAKQGLEMYLLTPSNTLWKLSPTGQLSRIGTFPTGDNP